MSESEQMPAEAKHLLGKYVQLRKKIHTLPDGGQRNQLIGRLERLGNILETTYGLMLAPR